MEKNIEQFTIKKSRSPAPSIELDVDSIYGEHFQESLEKALFDYAAAHPDKKTSIFTFSTTSANFFRPTQSFYYIVPGAKELLQKMHTALRRIPNIKVRFGEYIPPSTGTLEYHIEDGIAWRKDDPITMTALTGVRPSKDSAGNV
jgi:hypothetical protein